MEITASPHPNSDLNPWVRNTFQLTYIFLLTTATITIIEALRTPVPVIRHIMNLETAISVIAGYFYSVFMQKIESGSFQWSELVKLRYIDWSLTTPLMLTVLSVVMGQNIGVPLTFSFLFIILALNYVMLGLGYLGETGVLPRVGANIAGFIAFVTMYYLLYKTFIQPKRVFANDLIYGLYLVVWSIYGIAYYFDDITKNTVYNVLDVISKVFVGLGLWVYFTGVIGKKKII